ncbi:unnamed protein product [Cochlearia groenlandica]
MDQPGIDTQASDFVIIVATVMIFAVFVVGLASVCYRWSSRQFSSLDRSVNRFTDSDFEFSTVIRSRRITPAAHGIDAAVVKTFPTFLYSEVKERRIGKGGVECAVCLCEFEDEETLRLMPNCCHVFHADCVSVWLYDHTTCPLCRMDLLLQPDSDVDLLRGVTWTNRNRPSRSMSTRLSHCRVSDVLFSRSHSTGHCVVQPVENVDRFTLRLPEDVRRQLAKTVSHMELTQVRSSRCGYRSKSVGSERSVFSEKHNNRRLHTMTFSFSDCVESTSGAGHATRSSFRPIVPSERSVGPLQPDDRV